MKLILGSITVSLDMALHGEMMVQVYCTIKLYVLCCLATQFQSLKSLEQETKGSQGS